MRISAEYTTAQRDLRAAEVLEYDDELVNNLDRFMRSIARHTASLNTTDNKTLRSIVRHAYQLSKRPLKLTALIDPQVGDRTKRDSGLRRSTPRYASRGPVVAEEKGDQGLHF